MKSRVLFYYALAVYASGLGRFLFFPGGTNGLWYGLVMGTVALLGSILHRKGKPGTGLVLGFLAIAFVGGWYAWECFVVEGFAGAEWRQLIMIVISLIVGFLLGRKSR